MTFPATGSPARRQRVIGAATAWAVLAVCVALYAWIFLPLVPGSNGKFGGDYGLHFPNLLSGYFHFLANGPFSIPWFTPAQCGGIPFLADLNVGYYSLPQWLTFVVGPVVAIQATFVIFAALGAAGFYLLARTRFDLSPAASLTAAVLFLFNGFVAYRMAIGHLTFHPFMLTPWLAWAMLPPTGAERAVPWRWPRVMLATVLVGVILAYQFHSGMVHVIVPTVIAVAVIILIHGHFFGHSWRPWAILAVAIILSVGLSAQRLAAALAFLDAFPRNLYPLPGFGNPLDIVMVAFVSVFWRAPADMAMLAIENYRWILSRHEWEYGVGPAALILLAVGAAVVGAGWILRGLPRGRRIEGALIGVAIVVALSLPIVVNIYTPAWNNVLKHIPVLGSSVSLVRWFVMYIPLAALAGGLALDRIVPGWHLRVAGFAAVAVATIWWNAIADKTYYPQTYDGAPIVEAWENVRSANQIPPISRINAEFDKAGTVEMPIERNNWMVAGISQLACYQPMFGYRLEAFPVGEMRPGTILDQTRNGDLNFKNPSCYLFPRENRCLPGDGFHAAQIEDAILFAQYLPFPFQRSTTQVIADAVNLAALVLAAAAAIIASGALLVTRRRKVPAGVSG